LKQKLTSEKITINVTSEVAHKYREFLKRDITAVTTTKFRAKKEINPTTK